MLLIKLETYLQKLIGGLALSLDHKCKARVGITVIEKHFSLLS
jgi:hypothetical protein